MISDRIDTFSMMWTAAAKYVRLRINHSSVSIA